VQANQFIILLKKILLVFIITFFMEVPLLKFTITFLYLSLHLILQHKVTETEAKVLMS